MLQNKLHVLVDLFIVASDSGMEKILKVRHQSPESLFGLSQTFLGLKCFSKSQLNLQNKVFPIFFSSFLFT